MADLAQGLCGADSPWRRSEWVISSDAPLVHHSLLLRVKFQFSIRMLLGARRGRGLAVQLACGGECGSAESRREQWRRLGSWPEKYSTIMNAMFRGMLSFKS